MANVMFEKSIFPQCDGTNVNSDLRKILNYLYVLQEQLRYALAHLDSDNFPELDGIISELRAETDNAIAQVVTEVGENYATITMLAQLETDEATARASLEQSVKSYTDGRIESTTEMINSVETSLSSSIASVRSTANNNSASISTLTSYVNSNTTSIASIEQSVDANSSEISAVAAYCGESSGYSLARFTLNAINGQSSAKLQADKITFAGYVDFITAADVGSGGSTVIDGGRIQTGAVSASYVGANNGQYITFGAPIYLDTAYPSISGIEYLYFGANKRIYTDSASDALYLYSSYGVVCYGDNLQARYNGSLYKYIHEGDINNYIDARLSAKGLI